MKLALFLIAAAGAAHAGLTVTAENPGIQTTAVQGAVVYNFNNLGTGLITSATTAAFGSITGTYNQLYIRPADLYGGANGSNYPVAAVGYGVGSYSLTLSAPVNYFGMWWSAGDSANRLDFYLGGTLVGSFTTATALGVLPNTYYGNPNNNSDTGEPFAYLNFYGTAGTTFDRVVFTVTNDFGGFESDNHAVAANATPGGGLLISGTLPSATAPVGTPALSDATLAGLALTLLAAGLWLLRPQKVA